MILDSTILKFEKLVFNYGFVPSEFEVKSLFSNGNDLLYFKYKAKEQFIYEWKFVENKQSQIWQMKSGQFPFSIHQTNYLNYHNFYEIELLGLKHFGEWLSKVCTELDAAEHRKYLHNPFEYEYEDDDMDKPFSSFQKELALNGIKTWIKRIESSGISLKLIDVLAEVGAETISELESEYNSFNGNEVEPKKQKHYSKRNIFRRFNTKIVGVLLAAVGLIGDNAFDHFMDTYFWTKDNAKVIQITNQSFYYNTTNTILEDERVQTILNQNKITNISITREPPKMLNNSSEQLEENN